MQGPKITVGFPTYNRSELLPGVMKSILAQDIQDYEIVICDDASTDDTYETIERFRSDSIRLYRNERNLGHTRNQQKVLELARGEYVIMVHDDNVLDPDALERLSSILDGHPEVGIVGCGVRVLDQKRRLLRTWESNIQDTYAIWSGYSVLESKYAKNKIEGVYDLVLLYPAAMMRRTSMLQAGGFQDDYEETLMINRLLMVSKYAQVKRALIEVMLFQATGRALPFNAEDVFDINVRTIHKAFDYAREEEVSVPVSEQVLVEKYAFMATRLNGLILWYAVRGSGCFLKRTKSVLRLFKQCALLNHTILFRIESYVALIASILIPRRIILYTARLLVRFLR